MGTSRLEIRLQTVRDRLEAVESALADALTGSSYSNAGASITRREIPDLRNERARLLREERDLEREIAGAPVTAGASPAFPATGTR